TSYSPRASSCSRTRTAAPVDACGRWTSSARSSRRRASLGWRCTSTVRGSSTRRWRRDAQRPNTAGSPTASRLASRRDSGAREAQELIEREGVLVGGLRPGVVRIATYLGVTDDDVDTAVEAIPRALTHLIGNGRHGAVAPPVGSAAVPRDR